MLLTLMLPMTLVAAQDPETAIDAERAFNRSAQTEGQWTAFRKFAAPDATMFVPQPVNAQEWLKDRKDPAKSVEWWPTANYVSCSGKVAVNTGGWVRADGSVGYFSTLWIQQDDGSWKWELDSGDALAAARPRPAQPTVVRASCGGKPEIDMGGCLSDDVSMGCYAASDQSLQARWTRTSGQRTFSVAIWNGHGWQEVLNDMASEPAK